MQKLFILWLCMGFLMLGIEAQAQERLVTGKVISAEDNRGLPGVNVAVKGGTTGTVTDIEGNYKLSVSSNAVLVFSFIGFVSEEIAVGSQTTINVTLQTNVEQLKEVVVTAYGIVQDKDKVNYSTQKVAADVLVESRQSNIISALQGQVAGVTITNSSGTPGGGVQIQIRGATSLENNNSPLFVIDGIPMDNSTSGEIDGGAGGVVARSLNQSNRAADLNPDDIESIQVLKGPAAAALYGSQATNGAVLITTKKGQKGKKSITYSNSFSVDVYNKLPEIQKTYGQGTNGLKDLTTRLSWGSPIPQGTTIYDNMGNLFRPAYGTDHNLSFNAGTEKSSFLASFGYNKANAIVPNSNNERFTARLSASTSLSDLLDLTATAMYARQDALMPIQANGFFPSGGSVMSSGYTWPLDNDMSDWQTSDGRKRSAIESSNTDIDNPYFSLYRNLQNVRNNRYNFGLNMVAHLTPWLDISWKLGTDRYDNNLMSLRAVGTSQPGSATGKYVEIKTDNVLNNSIFTLLMRKQFNDNFGGDLILGNNIETSINTQLELQGTGFVDQSYVSINNTQPISRTYLQVITQRKTIANFASLNLNYQDLIQLNLTGRHEFLSTLDGRTVFYPSVNLGYNFGRMFNIDQNRVLSRAKLRFSYAQTGKGPTSYATTTALTTNLQTGGGVRNNFWLGNPNIVPEYTTTSEIGLDLGFWDNRVKLEMTAYLTNTKDNIIRPRISQATGGVFATLNSGETENKGIEAVLTATVVKNSLWNWTSTVNFFTNTSSLKSLPSTLSEFYQSDTWVVDMARGGTTVGNSMYGITGTRLLRNPEGKLLINASGYPIRDGNFVYLGDRLPKFTLSWINNVSYKDFSLYFMWDVRYKATVVNGTRMYLVTQGVAKETEDRYKQVVFDGVVESKASDGTTVYTPNTQTVELTQAYFQNIYGNSASEFLEDGSWLRLRTISLTYRMPKKLIEKMRFIGSLEVYISGRNLLLFTPYSGFDPELNIGGSGVRGGSGTMGFDFMGLPATKGFNAGLKLTL